MPFVLFFEGLGGGQLRVPRCNLPAHLENSCDNTDKVAMEIRPALHVGRDGDLRFRPSAAAYLLKPSQTDFSPFTGELQRRRRKPPENLREPVHVIYSTHNRFWLLRRED